LLTFLERGRTVALVLVDLTKTLCDRPLHHARNRIARSRSAEGSTRRQVLRSLKDDGVAIVPDFVADDQVQVLLAEIDRIFDQYQHRLRPDAHGSDTRAWGADRVSSPIARFATDPTIVDVGTAYMRVRQEPLCTLANIVVPKVGNLGSGGGWHRDTVQSRQFKAMLYLTDVEPGNGPFEYLPGSHHVPYIARSVALEGIGFRQHRFSEDEVQRVASRFDTPPRAVTGRAGTMFMVDSSLIHRGRPIVDGERRSLTNYLYEDNQIRQMYGSGKIVEYFVDAPS
jgi:hypothetical protein